MRATGSADLDKRKPSLITRMFLEHALNGQEALDDSLRIIHAIDTDPEKQCLDSQFAKECDAIQIWRISIIENSRSLGELHTDRKRLDDGAMPGSVHRKMLPIDAGFESSIHCIQEV